MEHVVRVAHVLSNRERPQLDPKSDQYMEKAQELVTNENIILQTLGAMINLRYCVIAFCFLKRVLPFVSKIYKTGAVSAKST